MSGSIVRAMFTAAQLTTAKRESTQMPIRLDKENVKHDEISLSP